MRGHRPTRAVISCSAAYERARLTSGYFLGLIPADRQSRGHEGAADLDIALAELCRALKAGLQKLALQLGGLAPVGGLGQRLQELDIVPGLRREGLHQRLADLAQAGADM